MASVLSPEAHLVSYAWLSGLPIHVLQGDLIGKRLNIHGFWMYYEEYLPKMRAALTEAAKVIASGKLSLPITTTYKPSQIKEAIEHYERGGKDFRSATWHPLMPRFASIFEGLYIFCYSTAPPPRNVANIRTCDCEIETFARSEYRPV